MKKFILYGITVCVIFLSGCSQSLFYHQHIMRGQIVSVKNEEVRICLGVKDGVKVEDELNVYREYMSEQDVSGNGVYDRKTVGKVKITRLIGEHFSVAIISDGEIEKYDIAEISK